MNFWQKDRKISNYLGYFFIFLISFFLFFSYQTAEKTFLCPDSFYHAKVASFLADGKLIKDFVWLPYTILKDSYSNHHFLYHLILVPFIKIFGDPFGLKIATLFFATSVIIVFYWFLRKFKIKGAFIWTLLLFTVSTFLTRINLAKAPSAGILILLLGLYALLKRKYLFLVITSFLYVWLYNTWPILVVAVIIYCFANALKKIINQWQEIKEKIKNQKSKIKNTNKKQKNIFKFLSLYFLFFIFYFLYLVRYFFTKDNLKLLSFCLLGILAGLVINPYFPQNLYFNWVHIVKIGLKNYQNILSVGVEWHPYDPIHLILNNLFIFVPFFIAIGWFFVSFKKTSKSPFFGQETKNLCLFILSSLFLIFTIKSRRNIEYFVPLAILFSSFSLNRLFLNFPWKDYFAQFKKLKDFPYNLMSVILVFFLFTLFIFVGLHFLKEILLAKKQEFAGGASFDRFKKVSEFLKENIKPGEIIFHSSWDEFPALFYHNDQNYYIAGLDPTFSYEKSRPLYWVWFNIVTGKQKDNLDKTIKENFKANYVFVQSNREEMKKNLDQDKNFEKIYEDEEGYLYKIKD